MPRILNIYLTPPSENLSSAARSRRQDTIHHVNATSYGTNDILWLAYAHKLSRTIRGQLVTRIIKATEHCLLTFTNR